MSSSLENPDLIRILNTLLVEGVEFIVVGGFAAALHGTARVTYDIDIVYKRSPENITKIIRALGPLNPYFRGAPPGLPFSFDEALFKFGMNFTFSTTIGPVDLLGEVIGGGQYEQLLSDSISVDFGGKQLIVVSLEKLIVIKRAAGRPKDFEAISELEALREEIEKKG